jgi:hypothetical protein
VRKRLRGIMFTTAVLALALVAAGCDQFNAGGWLTSSTGEGKAHFAAHGNCTQEKDGIFGEGIPEAQLYGKGSLQYSDAAAGVRLHGTVDEEDVIVRFIDSEPQNGNICNHFHEDLLEGVTSATIIGEYRPQPKGLPGLFTLDVTDNGEGGIEGDTFAISLVGGQYNGYTNSGLIEGGNIQVK